MKSSVVRAGVFRCRVCFLCMGELCGDVFGESVERGRRVGGGIR